MTDVPFVFRKAEGDSDLGRIYRLRYQIYVEECGFEDPADHPNGIETDEYDPLSIHFMALHGDQLIGTIRLVEQTEKGFPLERYCPPDRQPLVPSGCQVAEISRLAVLKQYRRRKEDLPPDPDAKPGAEGETPRPLVERRSNQDIVIGLFKVMYWESKQLGLTHWCAAMEKGLFLLLKRTQIAFDQVGPEIAYHGLRAPYLVEIARLERKWCDCNQGLLREFISGLPKHLVPVVEPLLVRATEKV